MSSIPANLTRDQLLQVQESARVYQARADSVFQASSWNRVGHFGPVLRFCLLGPSFCSIGTILPPRPARAIRRRAQRRSRMARLRATSGAKRP
jgi:hypothetical protein